MKYEKSFYSGISKINEMYDSDQNFFCPNFRFHVVGSEWAESCGTVLLMQSELCVKSLKVGEQISNPIT